MVAIHHAVFFGGAAPVVPTQRGFFAVGGDGFGNGSAATYLYDYDAGSWAASTALSQPANGRRGAGNHNYALIAGGQQPNQSVLYSTVERYRYSTTARTLGTALLANRWLLCGTANATKALFIAGSTSTTPPSPASNSALYDIDADTRAASTSLPVATSFMAGAGTSVFGLLAGGINSGTTSLATTRKFTYSTEAIAAATNLSTAKDFMCGASNNTRAIFSGGRLNNATVATTVKYIFSGDTSSAGTALSEICIGPTAAGSLTLAIISVDNDRTTNQYTYASDARVAGPTIPAAAFRTETNCGSASGCHGGIA